MNEHQPFMLDRQRVSRSFGAAARDYDSFSVLQQEVGERLLEHLDPLNITASRVVDLGAGTGRHARPLEQRFPKARILLVDAAEGMLRTARGRQRWLSRQRCVCADAARLPFADGSLDFVFSNLMLQWILPPDPVFAAVQQALRPEGLFLFSTLGPDTLREVRQAWAAVDDAVHVNAFMDMHDVGDGLIKAGLHAPVMDVEHITMTYADAGSALRDLRGIGVRNANSGRAGGLTGPRRWRAFLEAWEAQAVDGRVPLTYEVVYGHAWKPAAELRPQDGSTVAGSPLHFHPRRP